MGCGAWLDHSCATYYFIFDSPVIYWYVSVNATRCVDLKESHLGMLALNAMEKAKRKLYTRSEKFNLPSEKQESGEAK